MNVVLTCSNCNFSQVRPTNKLKDPLYKKWKAKPINYWVCNKCYSENFKGIK